MKASIKEISESEYKKSDVLVLFEDELTDRVFGLISNGVNEYKFGWQSTLIKPIIKFINDNYCSIGIDLIFVIFDFNTGRILQKLSLDYYFYDIKLFNGFLYVITQLEIIKINIADLTIVEIYPLPDYFESIEFNEKVIVVKCIGDEVVEFPEKVDR